MSAAESRLAAQAAAQLAAVREMRRRIEETRLAAADRALRAAQAAEAAARRAAEERRALADQRVEAAQRALLAGVTDGAGLSAFARTAEHERDAAQAAAALVATAVAARRQAAGVKGDLARALLARTAKRDAAQRVAGRFMRAVRRGEERRALDAFADFAAAGAGRWARPARGRTA